MGACDGGNDIFMTNREAVSIKRQKTGFWHGFWNILFETNEKKY